MELVCLVAFFKEESFGSDLTRLVMEEKIFLETNVMDVDDIDRCWEVAIAQEHVN